MKHLILTLFLITLITDLEAQYAIKNTDGYTPQMGALISMLDDLKDRVSGIVKDLDQQETDFFLDENANRIGSLILHLAATEKYYQLATFYDEKLDEEKDEEWLTALRLGDKAREQLVHKPISYYLRRCKNQNQRSSEN